MLQIDDEAVEPLAEMGPLRIVAEEIDDEVELEIEDADEPVEGDEVVELGEARVFLDPRPPRRWPTRCSASTPTTTTSTSRSSASSRVVRGPSRLDRAAPVADVHRRVARATAGAIVSDVSRPGSGACLPSRVQEQSMLETSRDGGPPPVACRARSGPVRAGHGSCQARVVARSGYAVDQAAEELGRLGPVEQVGRFRRRCTSGSRRAPSRASAPSRAGRRRRTA